MASILSLVTLSFAIQAFAALGGGFEPSRSFLQTVDYGGVNATVSYPRAEGNIMFFTDGDDGGKMTHYLSENSFCVIVVDVSKSKPDNSLLQLNDVVQSGGPACPDHLPSFALGHRAGAPYALNISIEGQHPAAVIMPTAIKTVHIENLNKPVLFSFTNSKDGSERATRAWVESVLGGPKGNPSIKYSTLMFATHLSEVGTGGNADVENEEYAVEESLRAAVQWFKRSVKPEPQ